MKVCIIHVFFGELPPWFNLFMQTCAYNSHIDFLFLTNNNNLLPTSDNIKTKFISKGLFEKWAKRSLGFPITLSKPYKLCDFKSAYGVIFKDFVKDYDYWGYCDNDILFGDLKAFLPIHEIGSNDIISTYSNFMSGPLCIYRNTDKINNLFRYINNYQGILQNGQWCAIDENYIVLPGMKNYFKKLFRKLDFYIYNYLNGYDSPETKYKNYWKHKRKRMNVKIPKDITEVVWREQTKGGINVLFKDLLKSDRDYFRQKHIDWKITFQDGKLYSNISKKEIAAFHFIDSKFIQEFKTSFGQIKNNFSISNHGLE